MMRISGAIAIVLLLAACSSGSNVADEPDEPAQAKQIADIPESIYQPTVHAILALSGAFDVDGSKQTIETVWRRAGTSQKVRLQLSPQKVTVQALGPGRYVLDSLVVDGSELLVTGGDERQASPVSDLVLDPGDVIYGGDLVIHETSRQTSSDNRARNMVLRIANNTSRAKAAVAVKYARQAGQMQTRLLRKR